MFNTRAMEPSLGRHKVVNVIHWALLLTIRRVTAALPFSKVNKPPDSSDFKWHSAADIAAAKAKSKDSALKSAILDSSGTLTIKGAAWIPDDNIDLMLCFLKIAHGGSAGHRGSESNWNALRECFTWTDLQDDFRTFVSWCLLCMLY
eukprot:IDg5533t1